MVTTFHSFNRGHAADKSYAVITTIMDVIFFKWGWEKEKRGDLFLSFYCVKLRVSFVNEFISLEICGDMWSSCQNLLCYFLNVFLKCDSSLARKE